MNIKHRLSPLAGESSFLEILCTNHHGNWDSILRRVARDLMARAASESEVRRQVCGDENSAEVQWHVEGFGTSRINISAVKRTIIVLLSSS
jgi:hypothetical protein